MTDKLKPCPFCGSEKVSLDNESGFCIQCKDNECCTEGPYSKSEEAAIEKWNKRADISKVETTDDTGKKKLDKIKGIIRDAWTP